MRKITKKALGLSLVAAMTVGLVACGGASENSTTSDTQTEITESSSDDEEATKDVAEGEITGTITVLTNRTDLVDTKFQDYKKEFEEKYPGTEVKFEAITDYEGDVAIRMQTEEYGDVLLIPNSVPNTEFANYFEPLGTIEELSSDYQEQFLNAKQSGGTVYGLAQYANAQGIVYNKKVFADAGVDSIPTTPDEFIDAMQKIKDNCDGVIPYYTNYKDGWPLTQWQDHAWGSATGDADYHNNGIVNEKDPFSEGKSNYVVHKLMFDLVQKGLVEDDPTTTDWESSKGMINRGEIGAMVLGSWAISQMKDAGDNPDDIGYMPFPVTVDGKQYATAGADYCYAINIHSQNKATAKAWIDFIEKESGYAQSEGCISIVNGEPLPDTLADFDGVELIVDNAATEENEGKFDVLSSESEINLYDSGEKARIVEAAMGNSSESFDDIMNDWNERWAEAIDNYEPAE